MIGRKANKKELDRALYSRETCIIDCGRGRIYMPDEFYTKDSSPASLRWRVLGMLEPNARGCNHPVYCQGFNDDFDQFFETLLQNLTKKGLMSEGHPEMGDYYLVGQGGGGISVELPSGQDLHGRTSYSAKSYYPRREIDAQQYAKYFIKRPIQIAKITSVSKR